MNCLCQGFIAIFIFIRGLFVTIFLVFTGCIFKSIPNCMKSKKSIEGRVVLVTGSGSGIGRRVAIKLAKYKPILVLWSKQTNTNLQTVSIIRGEYADIQIHAFTVDVSDRNMVKRLAEEVMRDIGSVTLLVNNAACVVGKTLLQLTDEDVEKTINVNLLGYFWTTRAFLPYMFEMNCGHIVCISSVAGLVGTSHLTDYSASKFAIIGMMESLDVELRNAGKTGIKLTTVCPYYVNTGMFRGIKTNFECILPILNPDYVAQRIVTAILTEEELVLLPKMLYAIMASKGYIYLNQHPFSEKRAWLLTVGDI